MEKSNFTRRKFLATSSMATASAIIANGAGPVIKYAGAALQSGLPADMRPWYDRTQRWVQIVLTEGDSEKYDPQWWLDLFKRAHVDGLCLVAGGVTAFYPTKIEFHPKAPFMKPGQDMFGDLVRPAQKMGITIVARTDAQACTKAAAAAHPEWLNIDENGTPRKHRSLTDTHMITCAMGDYNFDFMTKIHKEIMQTYMVDGLFCNRWQAWARGMCYCETCKKLFKEFSGLELPRKHSETTALSKYAEWETQRLTELWKLWDGEIRKINPDSRYFSNVGIDIDRAAELSPTYMSETQSRGNNPPWHVGQAGKKMQVIFGPKKKIISLVGMTLNSRHSVVPEAEVKMWLLSAITNNLSPWLIKSSALNWDKRWIPALEKVYKWHYQNEKYMENEESLAKVAILFRKGEPRNPLLGTGASTAVGGTRDIDPGGRQPGVPTNDERAIDGMYRMLIESRIPFDLVYNQKLEAENLDRYKLLILPNHSNLTDKECEKLRQYVARGGNILATFETSLYDAGKLRKDFGLADIFGVSFDGSTETNGPNGYIHLEHATKHPILKGLEGTEQIVSTGRYVKVKGSSNMPAPTLTKIPSYPTDPMEHIYPRTARTDIAEVFMNVTKGGGRVVYFPGDIDTSFGTGMAPDHALLLSNAVSWAINHPQPVVVKGPGILEVTCWRQSKSMTVHLLNCTNPFMLRSAYREDIPVSAQTVSIQIPPGKTIRDVKLLVAKIKPKNTRAGNVLTVIVPSVSDHEVIAVDLV